MTSGQSHRQTVLIVEDDAMLRGILAQALVDEGFAVLTAETGEQALAIASTLDGKLSLVVTDVLLPEMNGLELAANLASLKHPPAVLFISGVTPNQDVPGPVTRQAVRAGCLLKQVARMLPSVQHH